MVKNQKRDLSDLRDINFTCESEIRKAVDSLLAIEAKGDKITPEVKERWIQSLIKSAREGFRLMTDKQYADHKAGRVLKIGDKATFIGPSRVEVLRDYDYERPVNQPGLITETRHDSDGMAITFTPMDAAPALEVKQSAISYLLIERRG